MISRKETLRSIALVTTVVFVLTSCGRMDITQNPATQAQANEMTTPQSNEAVKQMMAGPASTPEVAQNTKKDLRSVINQLVAEGKIKLPAGTKIRAAATTTTPDILTIIENIISAIAGGSATNIFTLASTLWKNITSGSMTGASLIQDLDLATQILTAAMPYILTLAPALAPSVQSLMLIIPAVETVIKLFVGTSTNTSTSTGK